MPYTLYVIELDPEVLTRKRFVARNPQHRTDKPCVYVGKTGKTDEVRFAEHKRGYKANRYARQFGVRLRKRLYRNHVLYATSKEAEAAEARLAARLMKRGYAVWWG
jgi:hypothetical protein